MYEVFLKLKLLLLITITPIHSSQFYSYLTVWSFTEIKTTVIDYHNAYSIITVL